MKQHGKVRISAFVGLGLAAALSVAVAHAELATSTTTVACGRVLSDYRSTIGPVPWGWSDSCDRSDSTALGSYEALSDILTGFGPALPKVGSVDAAASVNAIGAGFGMPGEFVGGEAEAFGSVTFYFTVEEYRTPPATFTPITYIEANGQAAFEGSTSAPTGFNYEGSAGALAILPDGTQWRIEGEISDPESSWFDEFSRSIYLDLPPNDPLVDPFYTVTIAAGCYAGGKAGVF